MTPISSRANPLFKQIRALADSSHRQRKEGVALLEGAHLAQSYLDAGGVPRVCIVNAAARGEAEIHALVARVPAARQVMLEAALFAQISPVANGGAGLLFLIDVPGRPRGRARAEADRAVGVEPDAGAAALEEEDRDQLHAGSDAPLIESDCIVLDGLQDAGNVGSILRSAAAAGVRHALCAAGTANPWSTKVLRAAMGAHFRMSIIESSDDETLFARLGVPIAVTDSHAAESIYRADLARPVAWVFGNEGAGVSAFWRERATLRVTIPQPGGGESLNVAAAAAVCFFEQARQRAGQGLPQCKINTIGARS